MTLPAPVQARANPPACPVPASDRLKTGRRGPDGRGWPRSGTEAQGARRDPMLEDLWEGLFGAKTPSSGSPSVPIHAWRRANPTGPVHMRADPHPVDAASVRSGGEP